MQGERVVDNGAGINKRTDPEKMKEDKEKVREYVKEELFERVVFLWSKASLEHGGVLHKDYT
jgi:hypothetical protein